MYILAIDPGNIESAYVLMDENLKPIDFEKIHNEHLRSRLNYLLKTHYPKINVVIEMIASYGMPVGKEVFETCVWIGQFIETCRRCSCEAALIYRAEVKLNLCLNKRAKDSNVTQSLIDRFAYGVSNKGKGTKNNKGWFYGFKEDIWAAYAVGVTYADTIVKKA